METIRKILVNHNYRTIFRLPQTLKRTIIELLLQPGFGFITVLALALCKPIAEPFELVYFQVGAPHHWDEFIWAFWKISGRPYMNLYQNCWQPKRFRWRVFWENQSVYELPRLIPYYRVAKGTLFKHLVSAKMGWSTNANEHFLFCGWRHFVAEDIL